MSLVLVITMAILVLVEAGYQYNAPSAFVLTGKKKANFQTGHISQHLAPINSAGINSGYSRPSSWGARPAAGSYLNIGYVQMPSAPTASHMSGGYANPLMPTVINNLDNRHFTSSMVPASANFNYGYAQNVAPSGIVSLSNSHTAIPAASSNPSPSGNFNNGYAQDVRQSSTGGLGLDSSVYLQPSIQTAADNINNGHSQVLASSTANLSNGYAQKLTTFMAGNLNSGYAQSLAPSSTSSLSNGQAQNWIPSPSTDNRNRDYSHGLAPSGTASLNNGNAQKWIPSVTSNHNTDQSHTLVPPGTDTLSNGLTETWAPSSAGNLNAGQSQSLSSGTSSLSQGYSQSLNPSETGNVNTVYSQSSITSGSANVISGYSQVSSPHTSSSHAETFTSDASGNSNAVQNLIPQSSVSSGGTANIVQTTGSNTLGNGYFNPTGLSNKAPVGVPSTIYKHVYFHLPPPEDEQNTVRSEPQPKKNYKILFIKVPSQERNLQQIAQIRNNAAAAIEHKTLIYVLVKKPEAEQPVAIPKQTPSKHEVFFVKYNVNQLDQASLGNGELNKSGSLQSVAPLEPGLVNGQKLNENVLK